MMRRGPLLVFCLVLTACVSVPSSSSSPHSGSILHKIGRLEARGEHQQVLEIVARYRSELPRGNNRARLVMAEARALLALGEERRALLAYGRAHGDVSDPIGSLGREILRAWGDAELVAGRHKKAGQRYSSALAARGLSGSEADDLRLSAFVAYDLAEDPRAGSWKGKIRRPSRASLRRRERHLRELAGASVARTSRPNPTLARGRIPADPRELIPTVQRRTQWGAAAIRGDYDPMEPIHRITVHHTARSFRAASNGVVATELRAVQGIHQQGNGWADIGYHFLIDPKGQVWEGRALRYQGAHAGSPELNRGNIGVCLLGNFEQQLLPAAQTRALHGLLGTLRAHFGVRVDRVYTHREIRPNPTACPGPSLQALVNRYRSSASNLALQSSSTSTSVLARSSSRMQSVSRASFAPVP